MGKPDDPRLMRLNSFLARSGVASRRQCDALIKAGKVYVNGFKVDALGGKIVADIDCITVDGKEIRQPKEWHYVAYHKPRGVVVTAYDPQGRETIYDALRKRHLDVPHLRYVGRLDRDSEGLILLSNDGELINALTHPRYHIKKVYHVSINKPLEDKDKTTIIEEGIVSQGQLLRMASIEHEASIHRETKGKNWYTIDLFEGKNRQIRRIFETLGYEVLRLIRLQFSGILLGNLARGRYRFLSKKEIQYLKKQELEVQRKIRRVSL